MNRRRKLVILPAEGCRRSQRLLVYLKEHNIPFEAIPLSTPEGQALLEEHNLRASPGILVDGHSINPFDVLIRPECKVDGDALRRILNTE